jgi:hypothetical protein
MTRSVCLQIYVSNELGARIRDVARARDLDVSTWARSLLSAACDGAGAAVLPDAIVERMARQSLFIMVGVDALLAGHPDRSLRERARQAYARKCKEQGLAPAAGEGGDA